MSKEFNDAKGRLPRVSTGILELDRHISGGLPKGSMIAVIARPGVGKSILGKQFLYNGYVLNEPCVMLSTGEPLEEFQENAKAFDWNEGFLKNLIFLDCYSWRLGQKGAKYSANPANQSDVSILLSKIFEENRITGKGRLVIDSFSDFIMAGDEDASVKFLAVLKAKLLANGITTLLILEEGLHEEKLVTTVEYMADGTLKMNVEGERRHLLVTRMVRTATSLKPILFSIKNGIEIKTEAFFR